MLRDSLHNDNELLKLVSEGDERAFQQIVHFYSNKVFFHAMTFVKTWHQAEEIAQDIFLHIWQKREKLRDVENFESYLFITSRNFLVSFMRKKVRNFVAEDFTGTEEFMPSTATQYENKELRTLLEKAIDHLPEQKRQVFRMIHSEGLTQEEIGHKLGIAKRTVRWNLVSATNGIKDFLQRYSSGEIYIIMLILDFFSKY